MAQVSLTDSHLHNAWLREMKWQGRNVKKLGKHMNIIVRIGIRICGISIVCWRGCNRIRLGEEGSMEVQIK